MAEQLLSRVPSDPTQWSEKERSFYLPLLLRVEAQVRAFREAGRTGNYRYLRKVAASLHLLEKHNRQPETYQFEEVEYIWEAYYFLRKRDGQGSPLPLKKEVKTYAALIKACDMRKLMHKLPRLIWNPKSTSEMARHIPELTEQELNDIKRLQGYYLRPETADDWTYRLAKAGLSKLRQESRD